MAFQVVWEKTSALFSFPTAAKWLSRWPGRERLLGFPLPQPPNGSPGGLGENVCFVSLPRSRQMALQAVWERTSALFPSPTTTKSLSRWSGRERLLGFPLPQPPNGSPGGLGKSVCLASLSHNRQVALQVVWERASAWFPFPKTAKFLSGLSGRERLLGFPSPQPQNGSPVGLGESACLVSLPHGRHLSFKARLCMG
jgi:hypothetical protein